MLEILITCQNSFQAHFFLARKSRVDSKFEEKVNSMSFWAISGYLPDREKLWHSGVKDSQIKTLELQSRKRIIIVAPRRVRQTNVRPDKCTSPNLHFRNIFRRRIKMINIVILNTSKILNIQKFWQSISSAVLMEPEEKILIEYFIKILPLSRILIYIKLHLVANLVILNFHLNSANCLSRKSCFKTP